MAVVSEQHGLELARINLGLRATTLALSNGGFVVWGDPAGFALKIFDATGNLEFRAEAEAPMTALCWCSGTSTPAI